MAKSNFTMKFCVVLRNAIEKFLVRNKENLSMQFRFTQNFLTYAPRNLWDAYIQAGLEGLKENCPHQGVLRCS